MFLINFHNSYWLQQQHVKQPKIHVCAEYFASQINLSGLELCVQQFSIFCSSYQQYVFVLLCYVTVCVYVAFAV